MAKNPGHVFEEDFRRSLPPGFKAERFASPSPGARGLGKLHPVVEGAQAAGLLTADQGKAAAGILRSARFTSTPPYDFLITGPRLGATGSRATVPDGCGGRAVVEAVASIVFSLELKSVANDKRLPFAVVKETQEAALEVSAAAGRVSGLLVELAALGECWFFPIRSWLAYKARIGRASMPLSDRAQVGIDIQRQPPSPRRKRNYWDLARFFALFGAEVEPEWQPVEDGEAAPMQGGLDR